jgi:hypothetical protein
MSAPSWRGRDSRIVRVRWRDGEFVSRVRRAVRVVDELERVRMWSVLGSVLGWGSARVRFVFCLERGD